jgi:CheY-like chemotaxis protein
LAIEHSGLLQRLIAQACRDRGAIPIFAENIWDGLSHVVAAAPAAILVSPELPDLPGQSLVAALKCCPRYRAIPIGMITSQRDIDERFGIYQPDFMIFKDADLAASLHEFLSRCDVGRSPDHAEPSAEASDLLADTRVLLVEDSATQQAVTGRRLHMAGAEVTVAHNGQEALDILTTHDFDLILTDIDMPVLDGLELTRRLRAEGTHTPILAHTARGSSGLPSDMLTCGFDGVISKTVGHEELLRVCAECAGSCTTAIS